MTAPAAGSDDVRQLAIAFTTAVATAGRLAAELNATVDDLQEYLTRRADLVEVDLEADAPEERGL